MKFVIYKDRVGQYRWKCLAANNEIIAVSEGYIFKSSCKHSIDLIINYAAHSTVVDLTEPLKIFR